jgi:2'-5' RNA ligase
LDTSFRSFISIDIDDKNILRRIVEAQQMISKNDFDLKLVKPENIHITLKFLGKVHTNLIDSVCEQMKNIKFSPFDIELTGLGAFPSMHRIRVIWIGIEKGVKELEHNFKQLQDRLKNIGFQPDKKGFTPHITLARVRSGRNREKLVKIINSQQEKRFGIMQGNQIRLKKSVLTSKGPIYSTIYEIQAT